MPWVRYEAEAAQGNVVPSPASRSYLTPESEASGRQLARLEKAGDFLEFTATRPANGLVVRYSIPDSTDGGGLDQTISLYLNGKFHQKLLLTSRLSWVYGDFPWTNDPKAGRGHYFFDECQVLIPSVRDNDLVRLQVDDSDGPGACLIDFIELETVPPPLPRPPGSLSLDEFGAMPDDTLDDADAFLRCADEARKQGRILWIPPGSFILNGSFKPMGGIEVRGAGIWHTKLGGSAPMFYGTGEPFKMSDLAIFGEVAHRNDYSPDNAFNGNLGDGTVLERLWIEHLKCGIWSNHGTRRLLIKQCRIRNTMADGVNLCDGTTDSTVEQCHVRNTGDDGLATWSPTGDWSSKRPCERNRFLHNTVEHPWHASGIGIYGGASHEVRGNLVRDTVMSGGGLLIGSSHGACSFTGTLRVEHNEFIRTGGECYVDRHCGSLWIHAKDSDIDAEIVIRDLVVREPAQAAITLHGPRSIRNVKIQQVIVESPNAQGLEVLPSVQESQVKADGIEYRRGAAGKTTQEP